MTDKPHERAPGFDRFEFRFGVAGMPDPDGINKEADEAAIERQQQVHIINARLVGYSIICRGGQSSPLNDPTHDGSGLDGGCIQGIFDFEGIARGSGAPMMVFSKVSPLPMLAPCRWDDVATPQYLNFNDALSGGNTNYPATYPLAFIWELDSQAFGGAFGPFGIDIIDPAHEWALNVAAKANGKLYGFSDAPSDPDDPFRLYEITYSTTEINFRPILKMPGRAVAIYANRNEREINQEVDAVGDVLYILGFQNQKVYRWSPISGLTTETHGFANPQRRGYIYGFQEKIYIATRNQTQVRLSANVYQDLVMPTNYGPSSNGPFRDLFFPLTMETYNNVLYIGGMSYTSSPPPAESFADYMPTVLQYTGTGPVTVARVLPGDPFFGFGVMSLLNAHGVLYAAYPSGVTGMTIAKFDGSTWDDAFVPNIIDPIRDPIASGATAMKIGYNGKDVYINLGNFRSEGGTESSLLRSQGTDFTNLLLLVTAESDTPPNPGFRCAYGQLIVMDQDSVIPGQANLSGT